MFQVKNCPAVAALLPGRSLAALAGLLSLHLLGAELRPGVPLPVLPEDSHFRTVVLATTLARKPNHSGGGLGFDANGDLYASTGDYTFINDSGG